MVLTVLAHSPKSCCERIIGSEGLRTISALIPSARRASQILPVLFILPQERNGVGVLLSVLNFIDILPSVGNVSVEDEWRCVQRSLELALSRPHCRAIFRSVLHAQGLHFFSGHGLRWRVLPKEF